MLMRRLFVFLFVFFLFLSMQTVNEMLFYRIFAILFSCICCSSLLLLCYSYLFMAFSCFRFFFLPFYYLMSVLAFGCCWCFFFLVSFENVSRRETVQIYWHLPLSLSDVCCVFYFQYFGLLFCICLCYLWLHRHNSPQWSWFGIRRVRARLNFVHKHNYEHLVIFGFDDLCCLARTMAHGTH